MLISFRVKNSRSIKDSVLDLTCTPDKAIVDGKIQSLTDTDSGAVGVVPVMSIFGANASGKSNLLKALMNLQHFILTNGISMREPFKLDEVSQNAPTEYVAELMLGGQHCEYRLQFDDVHVLHESLYILSGGERKCIFDVDIEEDKKIVSLAGDFLECCGADYNFRGPFLVFMYKLQNQEDLKCLEMPEYNLMRDVFDFFSNKLSVIDNIRGQNIVGFKENEDECGHVLKVGDVLREMGLDLALATYQSMQSDDVENCINYYHPGANGGYYKLKSFKEESLGTRNLLLFVQRVVDVLNKGTCLCVDEIDRTLHTDIIVFILQLFKSRKFNKNGAQLICTSHNPCIMMWLNKFEITVVSKFCQVSTFAKLSKEEFGVNENTKLLEEYLDGSFGGVSLMNVSMFYDDGIQEL
ncbi:MAG: ATP-binding protein [Alphaproteobacteria bacterium]|nr:ATP-binding protein [Alphaproteobacteria bacterium]